MKKAALVVNFLALLTVFSSSAFAQMNNEMDYVSNGASASALPQVQLLSADVIQGIGCGSGDGAILHHNCSAIYEVDLTTIFHTAKKSIFVAIEGTNDNGKITLCFIQNDYPDCQFSQSYYSDYDRLDTMTSAFIVYPSGDRRNPIFVTNLYLQAGSGSACPPNLTMLWVYDHKMEAFKQIFHWSTDCLEEMQFETTGKLAGDMILSVDNPTKHYPWPWGISVFKFESPDKLLPILNFVGKAKQAGDRPGPAEVIDIDMPEILNKLRVRQ